MTPRQADALRAGEIDIAIGHRIPAPGPIDIGRGLIVKPLFDDRMSTALVAHTHPLARSKSLRLDALQEIPFIWPSRSFFPRFYDYVFSVMSDAGVRPRVEAEYDGLNTMWSITAQGLGWTLGWRSHLQEAPPGLVAIPLEDFDIAWGGDILYRQDESRAAILDTVDAILAYAHESYPVRVKAVDAALPVAHIRKAAIS
jgi:DNA-binding transcriptional LysR family regulator